MKAHTLIKRAFERQKKIHKTLSLRGLAERVNVSPGFLSKVLSGQKSLNFELAEKLFKQLNMDSLQRDQILEEMKSDLLKKKFKSSSARSKNAPQGPLLSEFALMDKEAEWLLGKWYRLSLLDLVTAKVFKEDSVWVAKKLSIPVSEATITMRDLEKFGFLQRNEQGRLKKTHELLRFPTKFSTSAVRDFHAAQIKRALRELLTKTDQRSFEKRLITSVGVASNPANIDKAKAILHEALYAAATVLAEGEASEIYQINLQLFPQTNPGI